MIYLRKYNAISLAILFHFMGVIGILFTPFSKLFVESTPYVMLFMSFLLTKSQSIIDKKFIIFFLISFLIGMITEIIGVNSGILFGHYQYGTVLGPKLFGVPLLIGFNWFIIVFCADSFLSQLIQLTQRRYQFNKKIIPIVLIIGGALITTSFDFIMEPAAIKLHFWTWENDKIPLLNYVCWFLISGFLLSIKSIFKITIVNNFASQLFIVQMIFFLMLSLFL